jgi:hypothetical protein
MMAETPSATADFGRMLRATILTHEHYRVVRAASAWTSAAMACRKVGQMASPSPRMSLGTSMLSRSSVASMAKPEATGTRNLRIDSGVTRFAWHHPALKVLVTWGVSSRRTGAAPLRGSVLVAASS